MQTHQRPKSRLPEALRPVPPRIMRQRLETALERLLAAAEAIVADLDALDGDPDLEPSAGSTAPGWYSDGWDNSRPAVRRYGRQLVDVDDVEHDGREDEGLDEYSLGATEGPTGSVGWIHGSDDKEPSLGFLEHVDQRRIDQDGSDFPGEDLEEQCEDEGGQCEGEGDHDEREPDATGPIPEYADDGADQTRIVAARFGDRTFYTDRTGVAGMS